MKKLILVAFSAVLLLAVSAPIVEAQAGYQVIVNSGNSTDSISKGDLAKIFMKKSSSFPNGTKAEPVDQNEDSPVRAAFSEDVLGKKVSAIKSFWQKQIFSGRGTPPDILDTDGDVIEFVKRNPGAVGYISAGASADGVKVLTVN